MYVYVYASGKGSARYLGVRLGRLALGGGGGGRSSSDTSLSVPQGFQPLPLLRPASTAACDNNNNNNNNNYNNDKQ